MMRAMILMALLCSGCSSETEENAKAMRVFVDSCAVPLGGVLTINSWGNSVQLTCAEFKSAVKPITKGTP